MNLSGDSGSDLRQARAVFQAVIVAGATHEFQNHLAVIKEYSGLAGDLLRTAKKKELGAAANRSGEITGSIIKRANRAAAMVDMLNRFAHRNDAEVSSFKVGDVLGELCQLLQRTASAKKISLASDCAEPEFRITNNPSLLQFLIYLLTTGLVDAVDTGGEISMSSAPEGDEAAEIIIAAGPLKDATGEIPSPKVISLAAAELGAQIEETSEGGRARIAIRISSLSQAPKA